MTELRVLGYNIRSMRDDRNALRRVIRHCAADVVCLQEVPRFGRWRARRDALAASCGLAVAASRRPAGLAVLIGPRCRVLHAEHRLLSRVRGMHRRGLALAVLEIDGARMIAASTHLDLHPDPRRAHAAEVLAVLERAGREHAAPVILAGDVNEQPGGPSWSLLTDALADAYTTAPRGSGDTYSSRNPRRRIDGVFVDRGVTVLGCGVPDDPALAPDLPLATDHLPVVADLRLP
ncbi:endonuclease/exonuclease/phosphatase family protein [Thermomonospora catenispora]|uniref:endonuclease/exonuclease/phosphatase family protein n=1 Tax=Thermomonospora catenispora TaxID=2493090 RepID=UPI00111FE085|nr:endonuclease/exonuclease/phosphatase family protein [Thermomonospora catenispora]TNY36236.1 endonuclease/exonuclease/phosphatase [Thermomonospora catenispora]